MTTVHGGQPFNVKAVLKIGVTANEGATAKANFANSLDVGLMAVPEPSIRVPEPPSLFLIGVGAAALMLRRRLRER